MQIKQCFDYTGLHVGRVQEKAIAARVCHPEDWKGCVMRRLEALARDKPLNLKQRGLERR